MSDVWVSFRKSKQPPFSDTPQVSKLFLGAKSVSLVQVHACETLRHTVMNANDPWEKQTWGLRDSLQKCPEVIYN